MPRQAKPVWLHRSRDNSKRPHLIYAAAVSVASPAVSNDHTIFSGFWPNITLIVANCGAKAVETLATFTGVSILNTVFTGL